MMQPKMSLRGKILLYLLLKVLKWAISPRELPPSCSLRTVRKTLASYSSHYPANSSNFELFLNGFVLFIMIFLKSSLGTSPWLFQSFLNSCPFRVHHALLLVVTINKADSPTPLLHLHYKDFFAHTGWSAPVDCIGTFALVVLPLVTFPILPGCIHTAALAWGKTPALQVPTFRIKACIKLTPPLYRRPSRQ